MNDSNNSTQFASNQDSMFSMGLKGVNAEQTPGNSYGKENEQTPDNPGSEKQGKKKTKQGRKVEEKEGYDDSSDDNAGLDSGSSTDDEAYGKPILQDYGKNKM